MGLVTSLWGCTCCGSGKGKLDARVSQSKIASVYDKIANIYDIWGEITESRARNRAIELAEIKSYYFKALR